MELQQRYQTTRNNPRAGELRHRAKLYARTEDLDVSGRNFKTTEKFTFVDDLACKIEPLKSMTRLDLKQTDHQITHVAWIRYRADITDRHWLEWDNRRFNIRLFKDVGERKRFLELMLEQMELKQ